MTNPVVHFEIIGQNPAALRSFYGDLFGWTTDTSSPVASEISDAGEYGFIEPSESGGIAGGIGGGAGRTPHTIFYVGVADVAETLARVEALGGTVTLAPAARPDGGLVVAQFADPEGNAVGLAGPQ